MIVCVWQVLRGHDAGEAGEAAGEHQHQGHLQQEETHSLQLNTAHISLQCSTLQLAYFFVLQFATLYTAVRIYQNNLQLFVLQLDFSTLYTAVRIYHSVYWIIIINNYLYCSKILPLCILQFDFTFNFLAYCRSICHIVLIQFYSLYSVLTMLEYYSLQLRKAIELNLSL